MSERNIPIFDEEPNVFGCNCLRCGKEFFPTPMHVYKDHRGRYCSWTCFNHRNDGRKSRWQQVECLYDDGALMRTFQSATKAAEWIGTSAHIIKRAIENDEIYNGYKWRYAT